MSVAMGVAMVIGIWHCKGRYAKHNWNEFHFEEIEIWYDLRQNIYSINIHRLGLSCLMKYTISKIFKLKSYTYYAYAMQYMHSCMEKNCSCDRKEIKIN